MNPIAEVMKGVTDIPIALLAFWIGILLLKKEKKEWGGVFLLVAVSGLMGTAVHVFSLPDICRKLLWVVLYVLLFEDIRRFTKLMIAYISGSGEKERRVVWHVEGILYVCAVIVLLVRGRGDIYLLVVFMAAMFWRIIVCLGRSGFSPAKATGLMAMLFVPILLQALDQIIPCAVVIEHIVLAAALFVAYHIGKDERKACAAEEVPFAEASAEELLTEL